MPSGFVRSTFAGIGPFVPSCVLQVSYRSSLPCPPNEGVAPNFLNIKALLTALSM